MVVQYPHSISVTWKTQPTKDANGDWVEGIPQVFTSACRAETNGEGKTLTGVDGRAINFSFAVYLPKTEQVIPYGASVEISLSASQVVRGEVKNQQNGQLNSRLWV
ncbi:MAG: hypothetical protein RBT74_10840 [Tenuifilaceae bacterium]|jgi:hypothetical protein|nr:hypothetical protein [Tenuifilaceae bacterium]